MAKTAEPMLSETRLYDLVRYMRAELHRANLITNDEYAWLTMAATEGKPNQGSISAQRLATYDELRAQLAAAQAERDALPCPWGFFPKRVDCGPCMGKRCGKHGGDGCACSVESRHVSYRVDTSASVREAARREAFDAAIRAVELFREKRFTPTLGVIQTELEAQRDAPPERDEKA